MSSAHVSEVIHLSWNSASAAAAEFHDKWMTSDTWAELICLRYNLVNSNAFTGIDLNKVFQSRSNLYITTQMDVDHSNIPVDHIGIFRDRYKDATNKKRICYYACEKGKTPRVSKGVKWFHEVTEAIDLKTKFKTRKEKRILVVNGTIVSQNQNKRKIEEVQAAINETIAAASAAPSSITPSSDPSIFWQSTEAHAIFHPKEGETVLDGIKNQIDVLHEALSSHLLIASVIEGDCENLTLHQTVSVRERCQILSLALSVALNNMPVWKNWNKCCEVAIGIASKMGIASSRNSRVVRNWYQKFRVKRKFQLRASAKHDLPPFLERNKELCMKIKEYVRKRLFSLLLYI